MDFVSLKLVEIEIVSEKLAWPEIDRIFPLVVTQVNLLVNPSIDNIGVLFKNC